MLNRAIVHRVWMVECLRSGVDRNTAIVEKSSLLQNGGHVIVVLQIGSAEANDLFFRNTR